MVSTPPSYDPLSDPSSAGPAGQLLRRADPDRFFTSLFAPADKRVILWTLYAFNHELARAREVTREPVVALMRLRFWRDVVEGAARQHPVAERLRATLDAGLLAPGDLLRMIDAREIEADNAIPTREAWETYLLGSAGTVAVAAARVLGAAEPERVRPLGAGYGAAGVLRSVGFLAAQGRCLLPASLIDPAEVIAAPRSEAVQGVVCTLAANSRRLLRPVRLPRSVLPAVLTSVFARRDLRRLPAAGTGRGFGDFAAVLASWLAGRS